MRAAHVFKVGDIARYYDVPEDKLRRLIETDQIPVVVPSPEVRIHESDLEAYLETHSKAIFEPPRKGWVERILRREKYPVTS